MMNLPSDINLRIKNDFPKREDQEIIENIFSSLKVNERDRVFRCILFAAKGNLNMLGKLEELAKVDYRDVIMQGEYEYPSGKRLRNFDEPFHT